MDLSTLSNRAAKHQMPNQCQLVSGWEKIDNLCTNDGSESPKMLGKGLGVLEESALKRAGKNQKTDNCTVRKQAVGYHTVMCAMPISPSLMSHSRQEEVKRKVAELGTHCYKIKYSGACQLRDETLT